MQYENILLENLYSAMLRIRSCEESLIGPILDGTIRCPVHLCSGQEAVAVGICSALQKEDYIFGNHRSHGHYLAKGGKLQELIDEIYGKVSGCSKGRGGSMHLIAPEVGMLGSVPIVAGTISLALGAALASSIKGDNRITVSFFGDGATGEGVLYESLNFAAIKNLPIIFACENNFYSTHLPIEEIRVSTKIHEVAKPFGVKSFRIDGNDVLEVYQCAQNAVDLCRSGRGPVFIEFLTYRLRGHVGPDDRIQGTHTDIRPPEEFERWKKKDPIKKMERYLLSNKILTQSEMQKIKNIVGKEIEDAHQFSARSPFPSKKELSKYVFKNS